MNIRVLVADGHVVVREGVKAVLGRDGRIEVVAEAKNGRQAVQRAVELRPDLVLMDVNLPEMNGIEATRRITAETSGVAVLAFSTHLEMRMVTEALGAGVRGYLLKDCAAEELVEATRSCAANEIYLSRRISALLVEDYLGRPPHLLSSVGSLLTNREREVLQLITEGSSTKVIAFNLGVSIKTVDCHRQQIMKKLKLHSIAELTKYAIREGLTSLD